jgi:DNA-binding NarL/FixJ family response regulator
MSYSSVMDRAKVGPVLLVGPWHVLDRAHFSAPDDPPIVRCSAEPRDVRITLAGHRPSWILVGDTADDVTITRVAAASGVVPNAMLAMLGSEEDPRRCERWMRRGCAVYLSSDSSVDRVLTTLNCALTMQVHIVDRVFYLESMHARHYSTVPVLTTRETQVLKLVGSGCRNNDIAAELSITVHTVEFHLRHILSKLTARNRTEALERAIKLGLY